MPLDRRTILTAGLGAGLTAAAAAKAGPRSEAGQARLAAMAIPSASELGLEPGASHDQSAPLQAAIDEAASRGAPLLLPPGRYRVGRLKLRPGTRLIAEARATTLEFVGGGSFLTCEDAEGVTLEGLALDGAYKRLDAEQAGALLSLKSCRGLILRGLSIARSPANGIALATCSGSVSDCTITNAMQAALFSLDATGLEILHNAIADCANNGIQVWRSEPGEDGTLIAGNRIERIRADSGGTGQNGNGINVFRAGSVLVTGNRIADCAYSAIRGNAAPDIQMTANSCARAGEVALYAEFGFEGALIANNLVDVAAQGISVTNFNDGGRLAIVQGNLVRNLFRREEEPEDKRGVGISVEADTVVSGNVIEGAPTAGMVIGWGRYVREVVATGNLIRASRVGILVSADAAERGCLLTGNMISGAAEGGIRTMDAAGRPTGPDLALNSSGSTRLSVIGNLTV
jgi:uncharacterized secreted repeat protein (TIGR03808 family)